MLPGSAVSDAERESYNRRTAFEMERLRDFIILHYHANGRTGQPFWDALRAMDIPETLRERMELFRASARIFPSLDELFDPRGWTQVMIGQGIVPERWHPLAEQVPPDQLREFLDMIERAYAQDAARMPDHGRFVSQFAPMPQMMKAAS
jgi:tryptophan halogenase